jgi:SagB-type dehydrogenase family enzyme
MQIAKLPEFWQVWGLFSQPSTIEDAMAKVPKDQAETLEIAIEGMIECGLLEVHRDNVGASHILDTQLLETQSQSVAYHLSSARVDWINYSNPDDIKTRDHGGMDEKVREEAIPSNFKKARNSTPAYDLAYTLPLERFGKLASAAVCFGKQYTPHASRVTLDHLNFIINMSFAQTDTVNMYATGAHLRKPVPSGGARHPTEAYVLVNSTVKDIDPGCYHYNVKAHRLDRLDVSDRHRDKAIRASSLLSRVRNRPVAAVILHTCIFERSMFRYRESRSYRVMNFDLGHLHANEVIGAKMLGLPFSECYSVAEREIESIVYLDPLHESVMSSFILHEEHQNV